MRYTTNEIRHGMLLYAVTDQSWLKEGQSLLSVCEDVLKNGATFLQIREKDLDADSFERSTYLSQRALDTGKENNSISAKLYDGESFVSSPKYRMDIVDRVGGGDAFAAGLLYALGDNMTAQDAVDFAAAACCLKHSIEGDANLATKEEILSLMRGNLGRTVR